MLEKLDMSESNLKKHIDIERTIQLRYKMITEWKAVGVDFQKIVYLLTKQDPTHIESEAEHLKPSGVTKTKEFSQPETKKRKVKTDQPAKTTVKKGAIQSRGYKPLFMSPLFTVLLSKHYILHYHDKFTFLFPATVTQFVGKTRWKQFFEQTPILDEIVINQILKKLLKLSAYNSLC
ncbi:hypothetical protein G6F62_003740 [Rhizopus arrhizus]|nr:hypothetical protein G6F24_005696 [Rhizopus arrhizus]KAG0790460.1 hypothetical protein G6F21_005792 [Rhizopus arrhizus]KAG0799808.1 hypothetical protein G6F22_002861 [Rhizopus arrhizus]KAG0816881.1 hypothetical protein G6F20_002843 [Rhizopus arrhizus]KAG0839016.1 hypothetical protein G6F19_002815 [Rhizopus arrhizus]